MRILLLSFLAAILFAAGGALFGLAISAVLIELNCLADPGGVTVVFLLVASLALVGGLYGFIYAKFKLQKRPASQIRKVRHVLALICLAAGSAFLLLNAAFLMASVNIHGGGSPYTIPLIAKLLIVGFVFFGTFYWILVRDLKTGIL